MDIIEEYILPAYRWFISGIWFVQIVRQVVVTGGNIAESAFLLATLWVIINSVAHALLTWFMPTQIIELMNYLSVIAFSALPELIIIPVTIVCLTHWFVAIQRKSKVSATWGILYSIPAIVFLIMTILAITIFVSTGGKYFVPSDGIQLVIRCLAGWMYSVINMLFQRLGEPHYASNMQDLQTALDQKQEEIEQLRSHFQTTLSTKQSEFEYHLNMIAGQSQSEIEHLNQLLDAQNQHVKRLSERASSLERDELAVYPKVQSLWIEKTKRTVSIDEISDVTGLSKQRIRAAITSGKIAKDNRNKELLRVSSVVEWLKTIPMNSGSNGHLENDTDPLVLPVFEVTMEK